MAQRHAVAIARSPAKGNGRAPSRPIAQARDEADRIDLSGVTRWVGPMLRIVQVRTFQNYYACDIGTSPGVLSALTLIRDNPGVRLGVLADAMVVRRPNMTKLIGSLVRNGLILRRESSKDGRGVALHITARGRRLLERTDPPNHVHEAGITAALTAAERAELLRLLGKLAANLIDQPSWKKE